MLWGSIKPTPKQEVTALHALAGVVFGPGTPGPRGYFPALNNAQAIGSINAQQITGTISAQLNNVQNYSGTYSSAWGGGNVTAGFPGHFTSVIGSGYATNNYVGVTGGNSQNWSYPAPVLSTSVSPGPLPINPATGQMAMNEVGEWHAWTGAEWLRIGGDATLGPAQAARQPLPKPPVEPEADTWELKPRRLQFA